MENKHVMQRMAGIRTTLIGVHQSSQSLSSATKGSERAGFIDHFLSRVFPAPYRFGTGDITDQAGHRSGQLDVVVEYPFMPTLPSIGSDQSRLYLAEGVAAAIEVKSNLQAQWGQALQTAKQVEPLRREFGGQMYMGRPPTDGIPMFAVGYEGWQTHGALQKNLDNSGYFGALIINPGIYVSESGWALGDAALWAFISDVHLTISSLQGASPNPFNYLV